MSNYQVRSPAGKFFGPLASKEIFQLAQQGRINGTWSVRPHPDGKWVPAGKVPKLKLVFDAQTALVPVSESPALPAQLREHTPVPEHTPAPLTSSPPTTACHFCGEVINAIAVKCRHCGEFLDGRETAQVTHAPVNVIVEQNVHAVAKVSGGGGRRGPRWSPAVAALLSFLIPGLGQIYKGQALNGIVWFFAVVIGYVLLIVPGIVLHLCCIVGAASGNPYR